MGRLLAAIVLLVVLLPAAGADASLTARSAVVGGTTTATGQYAWQVAVLTNGYLCGGTYIGDRRVVTAAHCLDDDFTAPDVDVLLGTRWLANDPTPGDASDDGTLVPATEIAIHPQHGEVSQVNDVAIVEMAADAPAAAQPLALATSEEDAWWAPGQTLHVTGWGNTLAQDERHVAPDHFPDHLQAGEVPRVADTECDTKLTFDGEDWFDAASMLCAGGGAVDACKGDSGGPLAAPDPAVADPDPAQAEDWRLVGTTSWGIGCALPDRPGAYSRVADASLRAFAEDPAPDWLPANSVRPAIQGTPAVGRTVTCTPGTWTHAPTFTYRFQRLSGSVTTVATAPTYEIRSADVGRELRCVVTATTAGGSVSEGSFAVTPTAAPVETPPASDVPQDPQPQPVDTGDTSTRDTAAPRSRPGRPTCRRRVCRVTVRTSDAGSGVTGLRVRLLWSVRGPCTRAGRRAACVRFRSRLLRAVEVRDDVWRIRTPRLRARRSTLRISATDAAGNVEATAKTVPLRVR